MLCNHLGNKLKPIKVKNPQADAILACPHDVLGNMLHTARLDAKNDIILQV